MMLIEKKIGGIEGNVLVKEIKVSEETWDKLQGVKNPSRLEYFECDGEVIEIPLNDFDLEECYGDASFFAEEINSAINDGAELLFVEREVA